MSIDGSRAVHDSPARNSLLIVDDEPHIRSALTRLLRQDGYDISTAADVAEAREVIATRPVDVVISDQRMPGGLGTKLLGDLKQSHPATVRLILSGHADITAITEAMDAGVIYKFLTKPWDDALLRANVREAFSQARAASRHKDVEIDRATGLPTIGHLDAALEVSRREATAEGTISLLLAVQVDQHEAMLTGSGPAAADELMRFVARRLARVLAQHGTLCRAAPDGFAVLMRSSDPDSAVAAMRDEVDEQFEFPLTYDGVEVNVSVTISAAPDMDGRFDARGLHHAARAAVRSGDARRPGGVSVYQTSVMRVARRGLLLDSGLRTALREGAFELHYQPQIAIVSGRVVGLEALLRWPHPVLGYVSPAEFIPLAEQNGLILEIGEWVLQAALLQAATWNAAGSDYGSVAINVSGPQLEDRRFVGLVVEALAERGVSPPQLVVEITESTAILHSEGVKRSVTRLRSMGVKVAVDDFGAGFSNVGHLAHLPFEKLKVDRSLVPRSPRDRRRFELYREIVSLAHRLGIATIAEGVETADELAAVGQAGCPVVQGYFFRPPVSAACMTQLLASGTAPAGVPITMEEAQ